MHSFNLDNSFHDRRIKNGRNTNETKIYKNDHLSFSSYSILNGKKLSNSLIGFLHVKSILKINGIS